MSPQSIDELLDICHRKSKELPEQEFKTFIEQETEDYIIHQLSTDTPPNQHTIDSLKQFIIDTILKSQWIKKNLKKMNRNTPWK